MDLNELKKIAQEMRIKYQTVPVKVKVNEKWLEGQIDSGFIEKGSEHYSTFTGIPVEIDNTIDTFEFVYKGDK